MAKVVNLGHYLETFLPFCQRNLYESMKTAVSADRIPLHFDGPCSALVKQNLIHQWWLSTVTSFEEMIFGVVSSTNQHLNDISNSGLANYPQMLQFVGDRLPFGLAQVSNCTDDHELFTPRASMTCLTSQLFVAPSTAVHWFDQLHRHRLSWWKRFSGTPTNFSTAHVKGETAGEQVAVAEIHNRFPWGSLATIERIYHRGTAPIDLLTTQTQLNLKGKDGRRAVVPHLIETVTFYETAMLTYLTEAMREKPHRGATKLVLNVHRFLAPYKVSVTQSGGSSSQLKELNRFLVKELKKCGVSVLHNADTATSLEQQFQKYDEMGIPYCIVLNDNTLTNGITGLRSRDTTLQEQIHISQVVKHVKRYVSTLSD